MTKKKAALSSTSSDSQNQSPTTPRGRRSFSDTGSKPSWLLSNLADLNERMMTLAMKTAEEDDAGDTFRERAESYYQKRPQLMALLQDLYNDYIILSDRYIQTLAKRDPHRSHFSQVSAVDHDYYDQEEEDGVTRLIDSDAESSLSYQRPPSIMLAGNGILEGDAIVADLVIRNVEYDILLHEISIVEQRYSESSRKIELQKSLLEVLESERRILLNENARLGYRVTELVEENKGLASNAIFMKRKASELARCVLKMREDHRVYMLNRKIEDLQAQIYVLEKRNKEHVNDAVLDDCFKRENTNLRWKKGYNL